MRELKSALRDLQIVISDSNIIKLQKEIDVNGDGRVSLEEVTSWWLKKQKNMTEYLFTDPTTKWGNSPATTSREVKTAPFLPGVVRFPTNPCPTWDLAGSGTQFYFSRVRRGLLGSFQVGWFVARRAETSAVRRANQAKWRLPKESCAETLYATEYAKFAGQSPFSSKGKEAK